MEAKSDVVLSSLWTPFLSLVFLVSWFPLTCTGLALQVARGEAPAPFQMLYLAIVLAIAYAVTVVPKRVTLTRSSLRVSNFFTKADVPFSDIANVSEYWVRGRSIVVMLRRPCRFGSRIAFTPRWKAPRRIGQQSPELALIQSKMVGPAEKLPSGRMPRKFYLLLGILSILMSLVALDEGIRSGRWHGKRLLDDPVVLTVLLLALAVMFFWRYYSMSVGTLRSRSNRHR